MKKEIVFLIMYSNLQLNGMCSDMIQKLNNLKNNHPRSFANTCMLTGTLLAVNSLMNTHPTNPDNSQIIFSYLEFTAGLSLMFLAQKTINQSYSDIENQLH